MVRCAVVFALSNVSRETQSTWVCTCTGKGLFKGSFRTCDVVSFSTSNQIKFSLKKLRGYDEMEERVVREHGASAPFVIPWKHYLGDSTFMVTLKNLQSVQMHISTLYGKYVSLKEAVQGSQCSTKSTAFPAPKITLTVVGCGFSLKLKKWEFNPYGPRAKDSSITVLPFKANLAL